MKNLPLTKILINNFTNDSGSLNSRSLKLPSFATDAQKIYLNPILQRSAIIKDSKGKSGVYCWINLINGKYYIGSGINLNIRLSDYFQNWYYRDRNNLTIVKAINKYKMDNFALLILELWSDIDKDNTLIKEQFWIDKLKPEYNILKEAGNSEGYKHNIENIKLMKEKALGRKHSEEVRKAMSENRKGKNNSFFGKTHSEETKEKFREIALNRDKSHKAGIKVEVLDLKTNETIIYDSIREAVKALDTHLSTLFRREKKGITEPFRKRYIIRIIR